MPGREMAAGGKRFDEIIGTLGDFTSKENWDKFFTLRGSGDSFEWYAEWPSLRDPLTHHLASYAYFPDTEDGADTDAAGGGGGPEILVPGCGSSNLSEQLYDSGFRHITNIDFSKVIIADMLRRHVRERPEMKWRIMDMTDMKFANECFEVVLDKGGLDALMEPKLGPKLGIKYLREVKRVLKSGGRFLCLTLAESHVIRLIFAEFRFGWQITVSAIPLEPSTENALQTFLIVAIKDLWNNKRIKPIIPSFEQSNLGTCEKQVHSLIEIIKRENQHLLELSTASNVVHSWLDMELGAQGNLKDLQPGRRFHLFLGEEEYSIYNYKTVVLDAPKRSDPFTYYCAAFMVPKGRVREWLFSSEEGQWMVVESSNAARLIMVFLDSRHDYSTMEYIQRDLSPWIKQLAPQEPDDEAIIPFLTASDGVRERNIIRKVMSSVTGPIIVEDVKYANVDKHGNNLPERDFRRLIFERSLGLVQSEVLLISEESQSSLDEEIRKIGNLTLNSKQKEDRKRSDLVKSLYGSNLKVDQTWLVSSYHNGIVSGLSLIAFAISKVVSTGKKIRAVIIGLGAGILPMFLHQCFPFLKIQAVELDPVVLDLAKECFGFRSDENLKVHIGDGLKLIQNEALQGFSRAPQQRGDPPSMSCQHGESKETAAKDQSIPRIRILIVDADSCDPSTGLACPHFDFVEEPFLLSVKEFIADGLFVMNLVSRSPTIKELVILRMKAVFNHVFSFELEEEVNLVLIASSAAEGSFAEVGDPQQMEAGVGELLKLMAIRMPDNNQFIDIRMIKRL